MGRHLRHPDVTALLTLAPLAAIARTRADEALRPVSRGTIGDRWSYRVRNIMVVAEIAAALVLLLATVTLIQNLQCLRDLQPGFDPDGVFQARVSIPPTYQSLTMSRGSTNACRIASLPRPV